MLAFRNNFKNGARMKGDRQVIQYLIKVPADESTAIDRMKHARRLLESIVFPEGLPKPRQSNDLQSSM